MNKPRITQAVGRLIAMDANGSLFVFCDDSQFHPLYESSDESESRAYRPWHFDGTECVTEDCLPQGAVDVYYSREPVRPA